MVNVVDNEKIINNMEVKVTNQTKRELRKLYNLSKSQSYKYVRLGIQM